MKKSSLLGLAISFLVVFFIIAININTNWLISTDSFLSQWVVSNQVSSANIFSSVLSVMFEPIYVVLFILLLGGFLWIIKRREEALFMVFISAFSGALIWLLKHLFTRARPVVQFFAETGYSFPSGHSLISVVLFGSLIYFSFRIKNIYPRIFVQIIGYLGIFLLGLSRVYLNVHWFSDIIGGYCLGAFILFMGIYFYKTNIFQKLVNLFCPK